MKLIDANAVKENHKAWIGYLDDDMIGRMNFAIDHHVSTVLTIPDNPTNGDMIKAILPKHWEYGTNGEYVHVWGDSQTMTFTLDWWNAEYKKPTTKNDLGVDLVPRADVLKLMQDNWHTHNGDWAMQESMDDIRALPSVTPQEPKTGHISIDDVMSVFDDFMCGEVDEDGTELFLEMLKDKAKSEG